MNSKKMKPHSILGLATGGLLLLYVLIDAIFIQKIEEPIIPIIIGLSTIMSAVATARCKTGTLKLKPRTQIIVVCVLSALVVAGIGVAIYVV